MQTITNNTNISLPLAVWLLQDDYDYINEPKYISATSLMKPIRHVILPKRIPKEKRQPEDVADFVARGLGQTLHAGIERAWTGNPGVALKLLGYPQGMIDSIRVNPTDEELVNRGDLIPIYLEQRAIRTFKGYRIGGKFDMVTEGFVNDFKSTSAYSWVNGGRDDDYQLQGSLYRWLDHGRAKEGNLPRITEDFIRINYIFTDWQKNLARSNPAYPQQRVAHKDIRLMSLEETEQWVSHRLTLLERYMELPETDLPECTDVELWKSDPVYKYYTDPLKATDPFARASKNFNDLSEANQHLAEKGKGVVITVPGAVKRCDYCPAYDACTQKDRYIV